MIKDDGYSEIAKQTLGISRESDDLLILNLYWRLVYDLPVGKKRDVTASCSADEIGFLIGVSLFFIHSSKPEASSSNVARSIRR